MNKDEVVRAWSKSTWEAPLFICANVMSYFLWTAGKHNYMDMFLNSYYEGV